MPIIGANTLAVGAARAAGLRLDPYAACNFHVEIQGLVVGGFAEVSGLSIQTETETIQEGGVNDFEYRLPKLTRYTDLTLQRGLSDFDMLWGWYRDVINGKVTRKNLTIFLLDARGLPAMWWDIYQAYPIRWEGPALNAQSNTVAFQSVVLAHQGLNKPLASEVFSAARGAASLLL